MVNTMWETGKYDLHHQGALGTIGHFNGEFISRPRVGIDPSGTIGHFGEFISRPRVGICASGTIGHLDEFISHPRLGIPKS